jgi:hypothetical protein
MALSVYNLLKLNYPACQSGRYPAVAFLHFQPQYICLRPLILLGLTDTTSPKMAYGGIAAETIERLIQPLSRGLKWKAR